MIHVVVKGTKTVEEYKAVRESMIREAARSSAAHMDCTEEWTHGDPVKIWRDSSGVICIEYESGEWWHYNNQGEWW